MASAKSICVACGKPIGRSHLTICSDCNKRIHPDCFCFSVSRGSNPDRNCPIHGDAGPGQQNAPPSPEPKAGSKDDPS